MKLTIALLLAAVPSTALAWPSSSDWEALTQSGSMMTDPEEDGYIVGDDAVEDCHDLVGDTSNPVMSWFLDDTMLYLKMQLNDDPLACILYDDGQWGFLIETDGTTTTYEHALAANAGSTEVALFANTDGGTGIREEAEDMLELATSSKIGDMTVVSTSTTTFGSEPEADLVFAWSLQDLLDRGVLTPTGPFQLTAATSQSGWFTVLLNHDGAGADSSGPAGALATHLSDAIYIDEDGDDLYYFAELTAGTLPDDPDTDLDGLDDGEEVYTHETDPLDDDSDDDGLMDGQDIDACGDPNNADTDDDGLTDGDEYHTHGTSPCDADSDDDGLDDGEEVDTHGTDPNLADTDDDGLSDGDEVETHGTDPRLADTDEDGLSDGEEVDTYGTDPMLADSDNDGLNDGDEIANDCDPNDADSDNDGLEDGDEITAGSDPNVQDSDGDGLTDGDEVHTHGSDPTSTDSDGDGLDDRAEVEDHDTDPNEADSDGDGIDDPAEIDCGGADSDDRDGDGIPDATEGDGDTDNDGDPDFCDTDADGDGSDDSVEGTADTDCDGLPNFQDPDDSDGSCGADTGEPSDDDTGADDDDKDGGGGGCSTVPAAPLWGLGLLASAFIRRRRR